jgi:hypothetical protein
MMMQLDPQSRWQSWMRILALDIRPVHEPKPSTAGCTRLQFSDWRGAATDGSASIAAGRDYSERRRDL